jgi:NADH-quinone oxidoreductase subunit H
MVTVSALATTLFLGGWRAPWPLSAIDNGVLNSGWWPVLWFAAKVLIGIFVFIWLRGTLPRLRYDQFMRLGWKVVVPVSLLWIMVIGAFSVLRQEGYDTGRLVLYVGLPLALLLVIGSMLLPERGTEAEQRPGGEPAFPIPPMDLVVPPPRRMPVTVGTQAEPSEPDPGRESPDA